MANIIKNKTPAEIREYFHIANDFSPEEQEEVLRENQCAAFPRPSPSKGSRFRRDLGRTQVADSEAGAFSGLREYRMRMLTPTLHRLPCLQSARICVRHYRGSADML